MKNKKNPSMVTLYARDVDLWSRSRRQAEVRELSFSQYVEKLLREDEKKRSEVNEVAQTA